MFGKQDTESNFSGTCLKLGCVLLLILGEFKYHAVKKIFLCYVCGITMTSSGCLLFIPIADTCVLL